MRRPPFHKKKIDAHLARSLSALFPTSPASNTMSSAISKEFGEYNSDEEDLHDLMPPSSSHRSSLQLEDDDDSSFRPIQLQQTHKKSLLYYLATIQAFLIIYRTEVSLSIILAISLGIGISDLLSHTTAHKSRHVDPFTHAHISTDYTSTIKSKYDLTLGKIDHWCLADQLHGENDNLCSCEDPLEPMSRMSSHKWSEQHKENMKLITEVLVKTNAIYDTSYGLYNGPGMYDDTWMDRLDDDWVYGKGARFGDDDFGGGNFVVNEEDDLEYDYDDGFGVPVESGGGDESGGGGALAPAGGDGRGLAEEDYVLDVVFVGDSITEQRQGTSMGREDPNYIGIKEVFDKTFSKEKVSVIGFYWI